MALNTITGAGSTPTCSCRTRSTRTNFLTRNAKRTRKTGRCQRATESRTATGNAAHFATRRAGIRGWTRTSIASIGDYRWRMGRPTARRRFCECLKSETSPYAVRAATYEELVVRYGLDVPFEVDLPVFSNNAGFSRRSRAGWHASPARFEDGPLVLCRTAAGVASHSGVAVNPNGDHSPSLLQAPAWCAPWDWMRPVRARRCAPASCGRRRSIPSSLAPSTIRGGATVHAAPVITHGFEGDARVLRLLQAAFEGLQTRSEAPWKTARTGVLCVSSSSRSASTPVSS